MYHKQIANLANMRLMCAEMLIFCLALLHQVILNGKFTEPQGMNLVLGVVVA